MTVEIIAQTHFFTSTYQAVVDEEQELGLFDAVVGVGDPAVDLELQVIVLGGELCVCVGREKEKGKESEFEERGDFGVIVWVQCVCLCCAKQESESLESNSTRQPPEARSSKSRRRGRRCCPAVE